MRRYAQLYFGKVVDIREADSLAHIATIFGSTASWFDVTDIQCEIGYVQQFVDGHIVLVDPKTFRIDTDHFSGAIDDAKRLVLERLKKQYIEKRDKIRWIEVLKEQITEYNIAKNPSKSYGFECDPNSMVNFLSTYIYLKDNELDKIEYIVWTNNMEKKIVLLDKNVMKKAIEKIRIDQMYVNAEYNEKKNLINNATTIEEVLKIEMDTEE